MNELAALSDQEIAARLLAKRRVGFARTFVEPVIQKASKDSSAKMLLPNHLQILGSYSKKQLYVKCRKTAHSWGITLFALAEAASSESSHTYIGSYDEQEAKQKLNFLDWMYKAAADAHPALLKELKMSDGSEQRKFTTPDGVSVVHFLSRKAPTGAGGSYLGDEFSVEPSGRVSATEILTGAIGATTHRGVIRLGGTQRGEDTVFYQIYSGDWERLILENPAFETDGYEGWEVIEMPWWLSPALCIDIEAAAMEAPGMETHDRVMKFGNAKLKEQFWSYVTTPGQGLPLFQREFEIKILAEGDNYFELSELQACYAARDSDYFFQWCEITEEQAAHYHDTNAEFVLREAFDIILDIKDMCRRGAIRGNLGWFLDVGRHSDKSELVIGHDLPEDRHHLCLRANIGMDKLPFPAQQKLIEFMFKNLPITRGGVDGTRGSVGVQLAEWANLQWNQRAQIFTFTTPNKQIYASGMKSRVQSRKFTFPYMSPPTIPAHSGDYRKMQEQFLRVKKLERGGTVIFDVARNKHDHGDAFWSCAGFNNLYEGVPEYVPEPARIIKPKHATPQSPRNLHLPGSHRHVAGTRRIITIG